MRSGRRSGRRTPPADSGVTSSAVILPGSSADDAIKVAERAQETLAQIGNGQYSFSGGIARVTPIQSSAENVYRLADLAAYRAKAAGGARTLLAIETKAAAAS